MRPVFWIGYCNLDRIVAISEVETVVNTYGYITDFKPFSDLSISIQIEIEELHIDPLYVALKRIMRLDEAGKVNSTSSIERLVFLNITFIKGTGNLKIEVPAVPG